MKTNTIKKYQKTPIFVVHENSETNFKSMFAGQDLATATVLADFTGEIFSNPTRYTVQVGENQHLELAPAYLRYINHSCQPNVFFDTTKRQLITLRSIQAGEELSFFYPSTEWDMTEAFDCSCKSSQCLGQIQGANYLAYYQLKNYQLTAHIIEKYSDLAR